MKRSWISLGIAAAICVAMAFVWFTFGNQKKSLYIANGSDTAIVKTIDHNPTLSMA